MKKLYILGNGFDLWHGLPTGYEHFYAFAKQLLNDIENYYSFEMKHSGPWSDFEGSLGLFEWKYFYDAYNHIDVTSESFKPSEVYGLEDDLAEQADNYVEAIKESFQEWVEGIDISITNKKLLFPQNVNFITFNYTSTLQSIYGINDENILHIHGQSEKYDDLIFGHGDTMEEEPELDENGDSNRTMFSDSQGAAKYPFYAFQKPVSDVLENHREFFDSVQYVREIVVIGHSFNNVDLPYFRKLAESAQNAQWLICCYKESEKKCHARKLESCGVQYMSILTCLYDVLQEEHEIE